MSTARVELDLEPADLRRLALVVDGLGRHTALGEAADLSVPSVARLLLRRGLEDYEAELRAITPRPAADVRPAG